MNRAALAASLLFWLVPAAPSHPQVWKADLYAGRALYDAVSASIPATNLVAGVRRSGPASDYLYLAAAAPLGDDASWWAAAGASRRLRLAGTATGSGAGVELAAHGFVFRDVVQARTGTGATLEPHVFAALAGRGARLEATTGWLHYSSSFAGEDVGRDALAAGVALAVELPVALQGGLRLVHTDEGSYPAAHGTVSGDLGPVHLWAEASRWLHSDLDDTGWGGGATALLGFVDVWAAYRQEPRDPLYWNPARRTWSLGFSRTLGRRPPRGGLVQPVARAGAAVIRVPAASRRGGIAVAGDFTDWAPRPMTRADGYWVLEVDLPPGVYRYAFVDSAGRWFVPEQVAGRMADGMGGHVAVLVVQ